MTPQTAQGEQSKAFPLAGLEQQRKQSGNSYLEFLNNASMRAGIGALGVGEGNEEKSHEEDEVYCVLSGRATFRAGREDQRVEPGSILFLAARVAHKFHSITAPLQLL